MRTRRRASGGGGAQEQVPLVDRLEAELHVQLLRPVVGERLDEHELMRLPAPDRARAARRPGRGRGRGRRRACSRPRSERSCRRCAARSTPRSCLRARSRSSASGPRLRSAVSRRTAARPARALPYDSASGDARVRLDECVERDLAHRARVDEPVGRADVSHHEVRRVRPAELLQVRGEPRRRPRRSRGGDARTAPSASRPPPRAPRPWSARSTRR